MRKTYNNLILQRLVSELLDELLTLLIRIGIDFKIRTINLDGKNVKVQIWDTAG